MERVELIVTSLAGGAVAALLFPVVAMASSTYARVQLARVSFGTGPKLWGRAVGPTQIELRLLPISSFIVAEGQDPYEPEAELAAVAARLRPGRLPWREASPLRRILAFVLAPRLAVLAVAMAIVGPAEALASTARGTAEWASGALGPLSTAPALLASGAAAIARDGFVVGVALVLTKWLAFSVVTLPFDLAGASERGSAERAQTTAKRGVIGHVVVLAVSVAWTVGLVSWLARG